MTSNATRFSSPARRMLAEIAGGKNASLGRTGALDRSLLSVAPDAAPGEQSEVRSLAAGQMMDLSHPAPAPPLASRLSAPRDALTCCVASRDRSFSSTQYGLPLLFPISAVPRLERHIVSIYFAIGDRRGRFASAKEAAPAALDLSCEDTAILYKRKYGSASA